MALEVKTFGDPVLKTCAGRVKEFDDALLRLTEDMLVTMHEREGVGLAANQVGRLRRVLVAAIEEDEYVIVNPVIEASSDETEVLAEGCLSIPGIHVEVERPVAVTVSGQDAAGGDLRLEAEGLLARVFQHEVDHLDGVLILDRTDRESRKAALREWRERLLAQNA
ncbi:MAG: peptide deformylase [Actinomycetota bacterium]|nr:peptide deformylase [Actinomycetota bacterium]